MNTLYRFRNFCRLGVKLFRNTEMITITDSRFNSSTCSQGMRSFEYMQLTSHNPNLLHCRYMAKSKGKIKKNQTIVKIDEEELSRHLNVQKMKNDFNSVLENFKLRLVEQTLRTSANFVETVKVKYMGNTHSIMDLAEVGKKSGKEIILDMSVFAGAIPDVMEALRKPPLSLNPEKQGLRIIVQLPKVTREHRELMAKSAKFLFNNCKESVRNIQNKYIKQTDTLQGISVDDIFRLKAQVTALGNKYVSEAEELFKVKEKELLSTE